MTLSKSPAEDVVGTAARAPVEQDADDFDPMDDGECPNCGGEGVVYSCHEEFACVDPEYGCEMCAYRCDWCSPARTPAKAPTP